MGLSIMGGGTDGPFKTQQARDTGAVKVNVHQADPVAPPGEGHRQIGRYAAFALTPLPLMTNILFLNRFSLFLIFASCFCR
jgi:hypothetical protein